MARCRIRCVAVPAPRCTRVPAWDGNGRREARAPPRGGCRALRADRALRWDALGPRALGGAVLAPRDEGTQDGDPVRAVPRLWRDPGALRRQASARRLSELPLGAPVPRPRD